MRGGSTSRVVRNGAPRAALAASLARVALLALASQGCVSGHLLDAARQHEQPIAYHDAFLDGDRLVLAYTALVADDLGRPLTRAERRVAIGLADLRREDVPIDAFPAERLPDDGPLGGRRVALDADAMRWPSAPFLAIDRGLDGHPLRFVLHDEQGTTYAPVASNALGRTRTAGWVWPLLPLSAVFDAVTVPVLIVLGPAVIAIGD